ncbi:hypothetical protein [Phocaeicola sp.]
MLTKVNHDKRKLVPYKKKKHSFTPKQSDLCMKAFRGKVEKLPETDD